MRWRSSRPPPGLADPWTAGAALPGGDFGAFEPFLAGVRARWPFLGDALSHRLARAYGSRMERLLGPAASLADLGQDLGGGLTTCEVDYLVAEEWARTAEDILWRRSKLRLHAPEGTRERLAHYLETRG